MLGGQAPVRRGWLGGRTAVRGQLERKWVLHRPGKQPFSAQQATASRTGPGEVGTGGQPPPAGLRPAAACLSSSLAELSLHTGVMTTHG